MTSDVKLGVVAPLSADQWVDADARQVADLARSVQDAGLDSLWANDSLMRPRVDALTFLAIAATVTTTVGLGTAALLPALRRPVHTGHVLATLDRLTAGRLTVAVGAGFPGVSEPEYAASAVPWKGRSRRLDETLMLWRQMWAAGPGVTDYRNGVIDIERVPTGITPVTPGGPPVWLAADTASARRRAGLLYDGWLPYTPQTAQFAAGLAEVRTARRQGERAHDDVAAALFVTVLITDADDGGRAALDRFTTETYGLPLCAVERIQAFAAGPREVVTEKLRGYVSAGANHLVCRVGVLNRDDFADQVVQLTSIRTGLGPPASDSGPRDAR